MHATTSVGWMMGWCNCWDADKVVDKQALVLKKASGKLFEALRGQTTTIPAGKDLGSKDAAHMNQPWRCSWLLHVLGSNDMGKN